MATRTLSLTTRLDHDPVVVLDFLAALDRHHGLHPFLQSAVLVRDEPPVQEWEVVEKPGRYRVRFRATLTRVTPTELHSDVDVMRGVRLRMVTSMSGSTLTEHTTVSAPRPLIGYVTRQARVAHERTFSRLAGALS